MQPVPTSNDCNQKPYPGALVVDESIGVVLLIISMEPENDEGLQHVLVKKPLTPGTSPLQRFIGARWQYFTDESLDWTKFLWHTSIVEGDEYERRKTIAR